LNEYRVGELLIVKLFDVGTGFIIKPSDDIFIVNFFGGIIAKFSEQRESIGSHELPD